MYFVTEIANTKHIRILHVFFFTHPIRTVGLSVFNNLIQMPLLRTTTKVDFAKVMCPGYHINLFYRTGCKRPE
jgi:hypothetical protein